MNALQAFADLESPLHPVPEIGFPGALVGLNGQLDAKKICDEWPRYTAKMSKQYANQKRKNWRGVPLMYRFIASIDFAGPNECWLWLRSYDGGGYGTIWSGQKQIKATHLVLEIEGRARPSNKHGALHSCDNPACCNPQHLRWGTQKENSADMMSRDRHNGDGLAVAHRRHRNNPYCRSGRHLLAETARFERSGKRVCKACEKERRRARRARI